jgi:hypothetical protein
MRFYFVTLIVVVFANLSYGTREVPHSRVGTVGNPNIPLNIDCALRAFTIEMAANSAPDPFKANWTALTQSAFQMNQCNGTSYGNFQPPK